MTKLFTRFFMGLGLLALVGSNLFSANQPDQAPAKPPSDNPAAASSPETSDHARSYYHFMLARRYKELAEAYNRSDFVDRAIAEYKLAIEADPDSLFLRTELAELYSLSGHTEEGIAQAEDVLKKDPDYPDAHRLLSRIYYHNVDSGQGGESVSKEDLAKAITHLEVLARVDPSDADSLMLLGHLYRVNDQPEKAEDIFRKVLQVDPSSKVGIANLAEIYIQNGQFDEAIDALNKVPDSDMDSQMYGMLAYSYTQTQKYDKAIAIYEKVLAQDPDNNNIRRYYAEALLSAGRNDAAREELQKVLKVEPEDGLTYKRLAMIDREEGRFDDARKELEKAKILSPDDLEIPYQLALLDSTVGDNDSAVEILKDLVKQAERPEGKYSVPEANNRALFLERLGLVYRDQMKFPAAMEAFQQIQELGPMQEPRAELLIIETLRMQHQPAKAMAEADAAVKKYPKNQDLVITRATMLGDAGRVDEAITQLQSLLTHRAIDRAVYISIAQIYLQAKRFDEAEAAINKALELSPNSEDQEFALFVQGSIYERQKHYELAEQTFKRVLSFDPLNSSASNYLGYMLADRGVRLDESVKYIQKALELEPANAAYLDSLGWAYFKMGRYDLAEDPLEKAAIKIQNDPTIHEHLGNLYLRQGKTKMAEEEWQRALKEWPDAVSSDFDSDQAKTLQKQLDDLRSHGGHAKSSN